VAVNLYRRVGNTMGRPPIGKRAMTATQMQRRWRAKKKHAAAIAHRAEVVADLASATEREMARLVTMTRLYPLLLIDPPWRYDSTLSSACHSSA